MKRRSNVRGALAALAASSFLAGKAMAIDLAPLWDFGNPGVSEQRFRAALETATGDDALILHTQIARTCGLRKDFDAARRVLGEIEASVAQAGAEVRVRYHLELGRTFASAAHAPDLVTTEAQAQARRAFERALAVAREGRLDALAIDAIHMFGFVDTAPADQLKWGEAALQVSLASQQSDAVRWEASIRNNMGYALHQLGRYGEALDQFQKALALRERGKNAEATRVARWMVAWTLRALARNEEALQLQLSIERDAEAAGKPDPYVLEELATLYRLSGDLSRAQYYDERRAAMQRRP